MNTYLNKLLPKVILIVLFIISITIGYSIPKEYYSIATSAIYFITSTYIVINLRKNNTDSTNSINNENYEINKNFLPYVLSLYVSMILVALGHKYTLIDYIKEVIFPLFSIIFITKYDYEKSVCKNITSFITVVLKELFEVIKNNNKNVSLHIISKT